MCLPNGVCDFYKFLYLKKKSGFPSMAEPMKVQLVGNAKISFSHKLANVLYLCALTCPVFKFCLEILY